MARNEIEIDAPADAVWSLLADADRYADFVVGTKRIRGHDPGWPAVGTSLHHTIGVTPLLLRDKTTVTAVDAPRSLTMLAGMSITGASEIRFTVEPGPRIVLEERPVRGPIRVVWNPVLDRVLQWRNAELLRRFRSLVERRVPAD